jgi:hypothetical protein
MKKLKLPQLDDRLIYLAAAALVPSIPLFYLYNRNAAQGLLFRHFLMTGGVLSVISIVINLLLLVSKLTHKGSHRIIIITLFWVAFWFFTSLSRIIPGGNDSDIFYLLLSICIIGYFLDGIDINRLVTNTIAILLCLMFAFNFVPGAFAVSRSKMRKVYNELTGKMPYELKTKFTVDWNLPKPNIYWLHMDGMMGFDMVERYFNDSLTELKNDLAKRGFVINKNARLDIGYTYAAIPAMTSPVFFDSYLASEFIRVAKLTRVPRQTSISTSMEEKGFSLEDIYPKIEILKALSDAGYVNIGNGYIARAKNMDVLIDGVDVITGFDEGVEVITGFDNVRESNNRFNMLIEFKELITDASVLSVAKPIIDEIFEKKRPTKISQPLPAYQETVDKYVTGFSDLDVAMAKVIKAIKYVTSVQSPHFVYFVNMTAHCSEVNSTVIRGVIYDTFIGRTFIFDENGNAYKVQLDDPNDVHLYLPQYKYAVKQMIAQIDTIIEDDPNAVIIIQADHGIHGIGPGPDYYDSRFMFTRGYSLEDQLNLNLSVLSAVRIPPQYGKLSQPLDPLDIARYLVNNFVGKGNYDYLYYTEE